MSSSPRVLMLSVDLPMIRAGMSLDIDLTVMQTATSRDFGYRTVPPEVPTWFVETTTSLEQVLSSLYRETGNRPEFDLVITTDEFAVTTAAGVAAAIGSRGLSQETAIRYRDKSIQKDLVRSRGIATARSWVIEDIRAPLELELPDGNYVIKPISGAAVSFTHHVRSGDSLRDQLKMLVDNPGCPRTMLVEEYVTGEEMFIDGIVSIDGIVKFISVTRYGSPCLAAVELGIPPTMFKVDPVAEPEIYDNAIDFARRAINAIAPFDGIFHLEVFVSDDGKFIFGECAARRGGGLVQEEAMAKFGVNLAEATLLAALGKLEEVTAVPVSDAVGSTFLPCPPGILMEAPTPEEIGMLSGVVCAEVVLPKGFSMPTTSNTAFRLGAVCATAPNDTALIERLGSIQDWVISRTKVAPHGATAAKLRSL